MELNPPPVPPKTEADKRRRRSSNRHPSRNRAESTGEEEQRKTRRPHQSQHTSPAKPSFDQARPIQHARRQRSKPPIYQRPIPPDSSGSNEAPKPARKQRSFVRPDREKIFPDHRQYHYRNHAVRMVEGDTGMGVMPSTTGNQPWSAQLDGARRFHSVLARKGVVFESDIRFVEHPRRKRHCWKGPGPSGPWLIYCLIVTFWIPGSLLNACGIRSPEQQRAWREKIGLIGVIIFLMTAIGFLTFGFTRTVCQAHPARYHGANGAISSTSVIIHGYNYDFSNFLHPATSTGFDGTTNPLNTGGWNLPANDASFLFQNTNQNCYSRITKAENSNITGSGLFLDWYFPCNIYRQDGGEGVNFTNYDSSMTCHVATSTKAMLSNSGMTPTLGQVYYTWDDVRNPGRNLAVYQSAVLDLNLLQWLNRTQVNYPALFDSLKNANGTFNGRDLTMYFARTKQKQLAWCLQDLVTIGFIDSKTLGCVASEIIVYICLAFAIGVVSIRFLMALIFQCISPRLSSFSPETYAQRMQRAREIELWSDTYKPPVEKRPIALAERQCPFPLAYVIPQPPIDYEPFNFPLVHTICLVTVYSESSEKLRFCLDALATTDYPNSHKLIVIVTDGMVNGQGSTRTTPDIVLSMMKNFVVPPYEVEPHSYVAIADGHKRHNMAKVYAGFYRYSKSTTVERAKQQRVPIVLVAKVGNPLEEHEPRRGNRGKRDSQTVLISLLQKVLFDERMTTLEFELFNSIWRVTGVCPDRYELLLCVDADTKVSEDALARMVACMVRDEEIVGLCGETRIMNEKDTFVSKMQVFDYYISHHLTKAFESVFGGVTCLTGCFTLYRIKAPKGNSGFWVPILANPDIVEHYSENVVDTLHKKNLMLLGEDRYLTTLLLKTFPKRKTMFCPQAVCMTIVPDTFGALLSQRRRWINSTVHNLAELVLVRELCGTFCFSMQFVIALELVGNLVLPAAFAFTVYLVIDAIVHSRSQNIAPIMLFLIMLGVPGLLIIVTSRKVAHLGWMLVHFISLPIWHCIIPIYAFWHFDDFSWSQRSSSSANEKPDGEMVGVFDASQIVMKRWAAFEADRVMRAGIMADGSSDVVPSYL